MLFFPVFDQVKPLVRLTFLDVFVHFGDSLFCISNNGDIYLNVSGNGCCININVDNLGMWCKFMKFSGDSVIESGSDGEQHIAVAA